MGTILALANQKGGVGNPTTAVNVAACLAEAGAKTLVVDLDPQANATSGLGERANGTSSFVLLDGAPLEEIVHTTRFENLHVVPSRPELAGAAVELAAHGHGESFLAGALAAARERTPILRRLPALPRPLTVTGLAAADRVLVPVQCEYYALEGLAQPLHSVERGRARLCSKPALAGMLLTMVDGRTRLAADVAAEVRLHFGELASTPCPPKRPPCRGAELWPAHHRRRPGLCPADADDRVASELVDRTQTAQPRPPPIGGCKASPGGVLSATDSPICASRPGPLGSHARKAAA